MTFDEIEKRAQDDEAFEKALQKIADILRELAEICSEADAMNELDMLAVQKANDERERIMGEYEIVCRIAASCVAVYMMIRSRRKIPP